VAATALIKFTQGATIGADGQALFGVLTTAVNVANVSNTGVASWEIEVLYSPPGSAVAVGTLAFSNNGATPAASFVPDVRGPYRLRLRVWAGLNRTGDPTDVDIRVFSVKETNGLARPAPQLWPRSLPPLLSGEFGAKPDEHNFAGQGSGYAGTGADGQLDTLLRFASLGALGTVANAAALTALDETYLEQCAIRRVETYKDCFFLDRVTTRTAVPDVVIAAATAGHWWVRMLIPDPSWAAQAAWTINPGATGIPGDDQAAGTSGAPLKTRSEFYRRVGRTVLPQNTTVTVTASLNAGDTYVVPVTTGIQSGFGINWVGVPIALVTTPITAYTARSGSGSQKTLMTIDPPGFVSWTASGLVDKIIEYDNGAGGFIRATVVADMGSKTAWISPPINQNNAQDQVFTNSTTVNVYDLPSLGAVPMRDENATYKYLRATRWEMYNGRTFCTNCIGPVSGFGGSLGWINCHDAGGNVTLASGCVVSAYSGKNRFVCGGGFVYIKAHVCVTNRGLQAEGNGIIITGGQGGFPSNVPCDVEYYSTSATGSLAYLPENQGGRIIMGGYVYGSSVSPNVVECLGRDATASFTRIPNITGATLVKFGLAGSTPDVSLLSAQELRDAFNNRVIGPFGPQ
jgi:hypothetical protein